MPTRNQLRANRMNSKLSTGPKTPEGKAVSRFNALIHGCRAEVRHPPRRGSRKIPPSPRQAPHRLAASGRHSKKTWSTRSPSTSGSWPVWMPPKPISTTPASCLPPNSPWPSNAFPSPRTAWNAPFPAPSSISSATAKTVSSARKTWSPKAATAAVAPRACSGKSTAASPSTCCRSSAASTAYGASSPRPPRRPRTPARPPRLRRAHQCYRAATVRESVPRLHRAATVRESVLRLTEPRP